MGLLLLLVVVTGASYYKMQNEEKEEDHEDYEENDCSSIASCDIIVHEVHVGFGWISTCCFTKHLIPPFNLSKARWLLHHQ